MGKVIQATDFSNLKNLLKEQQKLEDNRIKEANRKSYKKNQSKKETESGIDKVYRAFNELDDRTQKYIIQFPKSQRYTIVKEFELLILKIERYLVECSLKYHKKTTVTNLHIEVEVFRKYITRCLTRNLINKSTRDKSIRCVNNLGTELEEFMKKL